MSKSGYDPFLTREEEKHKALNKRAFEALKNSTNPADKKLFKRVLKKAEKQLARKNRNFSIWKRLSIPVNLSLIPLSAYVAGFPLLLKAALFAGATYVGYRGAKRGYENLPAQTQDKIKRFYKPIKSTLAATFTTLWQDTTAASSFLARQFLRPRYGSFLTFSALPLAIIGMGTMPFLTTAAGLWSAGRLLKYGYDALPEQTQNNIRKTIEPYFAETSLTKSIKNILNTPLLSKKTRRQMGKPHWHCYR